MKYIIYLLIILIFREKKNSVIFYQKNLVLILGENYHSQNNILIYKVNNKNLFGLKMILSFFYKNEKDNCVKFIKEIGYEKYQQFLLLGEDDYASPIFNIYQNQNGNAYKYDSSIQDYTNYNIN